jgi:hypothetical protein
LSCIVQHCPIISFTFLQLLCPALYNVAAKTGLGLTLEPPRV